MISRQQVRFPIIAYLWQPLGHDRVKLILNPIKFKQLYHRWLLEMCWHQSDLHKMDKCEK
ncbi:hypothetical protein [Chamaesiphon polymorphus]|uniref:hypothetical protein n=1 Tax=Chamaesiphon polymorphus TaxID=2107691 RepID=UPI0011B2956D|nr:hypothetical protein [Chamaesiphon polymorphus]